MCQSGMTYFTEKIILLSMSLICLCVACGRIDPLEHALRLSGENRFELEKVLIHYAKNPADQLKLEAAKFLIRNMPGHGSFTDSVTVHYYKVVDSLYFDLPPYTKLPILCLPDYYNTPGLHIREDIHYITAEFLINHIDRLFAIYWETPWKNAFSFDVFCEHLLPYRTGCEPLQDTESKYLSPRQIDSLLKPWNEYTIDALSFKTYVLTHVFPKKTIRYNLPAPVNDSAYIPDCITDAEQYMLTNKYLGIPAAIDFSPHWPDRDGRHYWVSLFDPSLRKRTHLESFNPRYAKVYRKTYSINRIPHDNGRDFIPAMFREPFNLDVTDSYVHTANISVKINRQSLDPEYAYLCVFNERSWQPVSWSGICKERAIFEKTGVGNVYMPVFFHRNKEVSGGYPFVLQYDGVINELRPDKSKTTMLHLKRKYLVNIKQMMWELSIVGVAIKGSSSLSFNDEKLLHEVDLNYTAPVFTAQFEKPEMFRFWKLEVPTGSRPAKTAEIYIYDSAGHIMKTDTLNIQCILDGKNEFPKFLFDNDPLTAEYIKKSLIIDFKKNVTVSKIDITARNDDNFVTPGDTYELLYRDIDRWVSLGTQSAEDRFVKFERVPTGALYWLRNLTRGCEERIFTVENETITFW